MFGWRYLDRDESDAGSSDRFEDQASAERWLGDEWARLLEGGVDAVELVGNDGEVVYRMSLRPAGQ